MVGSLHWGYFSPQIPQLLQHSNDTISKSSSFDFFPGAQHSGKSHKFCKQQGLKLLFFRHIGIKMGSDLKNLFIVHMYDIWYRKEFFKLYAELLIVFMQTRRQIKHDYGRLVSHSLNLCSFPSRQTAK